MPGDSKVLSCWLTKMLEDQITKQERKKIYVSETQFLYLHYKLFSSENETIRAAHGLVVGDCAYPIREGAQPCAHSREGGGAAGCPPRHDPIDGVTSRQWPT